MEHQATAIARDLGKGRSKSRVKPRLSSPNVKFTISLSPKSVEALEHLKEITDAATDSEVFRNALRLHLTLVRAHADGKQLLIRDSEAGDELIPVTLFAPG